MIIYWENHSNVQIQATYAFFYSGTGAILPDVGIWLLLPNIAQAIQWHDMIDAQISGDIRPLWPITTAEPSLQLIVMQRSIERFVFGGLFRRIN